MPSLKSIDPATAALGAGIVVICAAASFVALSSLAGPDGLPSRLTAAQRQLDRAQGLAATPGDPSAYHRGALCADAADAAAQALKQRALAAAAGAGLGPPSVRASAHKLDFEHGTPSVDLQIDATGRYDAVVQMLGRLSASEPTVFVDTLDLQSQVNAVSLKLSGHVFCRTPARS